VQVQCHVVERLGNVQAEAVGQGITSGRDGLSGLPKDEKTSLKRGSQGLMDVSTMSDGSTHQTLARYLRREEQNLFCERTY